MLISSLDAIGSSPSPAAFRVAKLRQAIFEMVRKVLDSLSPPIVVILQTRLAAMRAGGFSLSPGGGGSVIRYMRDELHTRGRGRESWVWRRPLLPHPHPLRQRRLPLRFQAIAAMSAPPVAAVPPTATPALVGMAALRPPPVLPSTVPHTDLERGLRGPGWGGASRAPHCSPLRLPRSPHLHDWPRLGRVSSGGCGDLHLPARIGSRLSPCRHSSLPHLQRRVTSLTRAPPCVSLCARWSSRAGVFRARRADHLFQARLSRHFQQPGRASATRR